VDFADDIALIDESWNSMQQSTSTLTKEANKVGLHINADKRKLMTTSVWSDRSDIQAAGSDIEKVDDFCYLGSLISSNGSCEKDVKVQIGKAAAVLGRIKKIWRNDNISLKVKTRLYEAIILSTLLYGADVWPLTATLTKRLDAAHHRWQRSILGISWKDRITNVEARARTGQRTMDSILRERRLRWLGHVFRMDHQRIPQQALYWQVPGYREDQVDQGRTGGAQSTKTYKRWGSAGRKQRRQLLTDTDGVGVWSNVSSWMRYESRSRSRSNHSDCCTLRPCHRHI